MHVFNMLIAESAVRNDDGPFVSTGSLSYWIPDEAAALLKPVLEPYGQSPEWYFDKLNFGRPPAPWAITCFDREYAFSGHIATARLPDAGIAFTTYNPIPSPMPDDFVPGVCVLTFASKDGLKRSASKSPIFSAAWDALRDCSAEERWLVLLDPPSPEWLDQVLPGDRELWLSTRR